MAGLVFMFPSQFAAVLGVRYFVVEVAAIFLCLAAVTLAWLSIRCSHCGLSLVRYGLLNQSAADWLKWLLTVKECPRCGAPISDRSVSGLIE